MHTNMDQWIELRRQIRNDGVFLRQLERETGIHRQPPRKIRDNSQPPGYQRTKPVQESKLRPYLGLIKTILDGDKEVPRKQRHTAKKIWEILQSEGFTGGYTIVKDAIRQIKKVSKEVFVPLWRQPTGSQSCHVGQIDGALAGDVGSAAEVVGQFTAGLEPPRGQHC